VGQCTCIMAMEFDENHIGLCWYVYSCYRYHGNTAVSYIKKEKGVK